MTSAVRDADRVKERIELNPLWEPSCAPKDLLGISEVANSARRLGPLAVDYPKPPKPNPENRGMIPKDLRRQGISLPILPENSGDFRSKRKADQGVELAIFRSRVRRRTTYANRPNRQGAKP